MKTIILILFFCLFCGDYVNAQTVSSQKDAQIKEVKELASPPVESSTTATLVSGTRNAIIHEVPVENNPETIPTKNEVMSTERKPK